MGKLNGWRKHVDHNSKYNNHAQLFPSSVTTLYRALVQSGSGSCPGVYSTISTIGVHNVWTGATSDEWNDGSNWSDGVVPTTSCPDVFVPGGTPNEPVLRAAPIAPITNLHILNGAGAKVTVNATGLLQIGGTISNAGIFDVSSGMVELNGTTGTQNIATGPFTGNSGSMIL